jgi:heat shock protein HslJ
LNYISGPRIAFEGLYPNKEPQLVFAIPKLEVGGINFGDGRSTMMACEGIGEPTFLKTLKQVNGYAVSDENVPTLLVGDVAMMRFVKK